MEEEDYTSWYTEDDRAPESVFPHADEAVDSGVREGMIVEVPLESPKERATTFWLAKITRVFGPLLECVYVGPEVDSGVSAFLMDLSKDGAQLFPLGYCQMYKHKLKPPEAMRPFNWEEVALRYLEDVSYDTVAMHFMEPGGGTTPSERLKPGMVLDVRDESRPRVYWSAVITANNGGLLRLAYDVPASEDSSLSFHISLFYLSDRLMRCNLKDRKRIFEPPDAIQKAFKTTKWKDFRTQLGSLDRPNPPNDLVCSKKSPSLDSSILEHFEEESLVEVVHPLNSQSLQLGVIHKVEKNVGVVVKLFRQPELKTIRSPSEVFPVGWSQGSELSPTRSLSLKNKLPGNYSLALKKCFAKPSASDYKAGQLLEVLHLEEIHIGRISAVKEPLLWIELLEHPSKPKILMPSNGFCLFPLGWAFSNNLKVAHCPKMSVKEEKQEPPSFTSEEKDVSKSSNSSSSWCEAIYINCNCSCLGFLSKKRLLSLPKSVGPGSVQLVMREVLSKLIGMSFKSGSVLKRLEYDESRPPRRNFCIETLKGKSKVLNLKGQVEIPTLASDVDEYCMEVCRKVGACPYLISTKLYEDLCPAACRSNPELGRPKKKRGNPSNSNNNNNSGSISNFPPAEDSSPSSFEETDDNASRNNSRCVTPEPRKKHCRREWSELLPKSEIQTRGAKIPNWKVHLQMRPSKKDMLSINYSSLSKRFKQQLEPAFRLQDVVVKTVDNVSSCSSGESESHSEEEARLVRLRGNPSLWSPMETASFLAQTLDCAHLARFMYEDQIDGPAFLLLNFPTVKEYWSLKNESAAMLCQHVESVKLAYMNKFYD